MDGCVYPLQLRMALSGPDSCHAAVHKCQYFKKALFWSWKRWSILRGMMNVHGARWVVSINRKGASCIHHHCVCNFERFLELSSISTSPAADESKKNGIWVIFWAVPRKSHFHFYNLEFCFSFPLSLSLPLLPSSYFLILSSGDVVHSAFVPFAQSNKDLKSTKPKKTRNKKRTTKVLIPVHYVQQCNNRLWTKTWIWCFK